MKTQFIVDAEGNKIAVIIPIEEYEKMKNTGNNFVVSETEPSYKKENYIPSEQEKELISRYAYVVKNSSEGKNWDEIEKNLTE